MQSTQGQSTMDRPFQRRGAKSNAHVGKEFEDRVKDYFAAKKRIHLEPNLAVPIGLTEKKRHKFDLGCHERKLLVECKSHTWTETGNVPSAKMTTWDQAMYLFHVAPKSYRKMLFVLHSWCNRRKLTLAEYYVKAHSHLIPNGVEIWEFSTDGTAARVPKPKATP